MDSPWTVPPPHRPPSERPWLGMAMLASVPLLSLILIRMLWSGSSLWFLTVGILLLGAAAVMYLLRRPQGLEPPRPGMAGGLMSESSRTPLILAGLGVLFLALLALPNFAGGSDDSSLTQQQPGQISQVSGVQQPSAQQPQAAQNQQQPGQAQPGQNRRTRPAGSESYVIQDGDTLWDIASRYDTTVEAIVEANGLANPEDLQVGQEIVIPPAEESAAAGR